MLQHLFLRDEGDPSGGKPELGTPDPNADPQGGGQLDPEKKEGLSADEKAELDTLKKDKETLEKRLSDTQTEFHTRSEELKTLRTQVENLQRPTPKPDEQYGDDPQIRKLDQRIEEFQAANYDTTALEVLKDNRIREMKNEERLAAIEARDKESDGIGKFLLENPGVADLTEAGKTRTMLMGRGEKVSIDTAHFYHLGKNLESAVKAEVEKRLEADKKGENARGQDGEFYEPEPSENKEEQEYAAFLHNPGGLDLE